MPRRRALRLALPSARRAAAATLVASASIVAACSEGGAPAPVAGSAPSASPPPPAASPAPAAGPRARVVDEEIALRFERAPRQTVLVELAGDDDAAPGGPGRDAARDPAAARARVAGRRARTSAFLSDLGATLGRAPAVGRAFPSFGMIALDAERADVERLAARPEVRRLHADRERTLHTASSLPFSEVDTWHASGAKGAGVAVAVLDTPIDLAQGAFGKCPSAGAPGCAVAVWENFAFKTPTDPAALAKKAPHGTNVAGIVHAVAPASTILGLNVFHWDADKNDERCFDSEVIDALEWVADHQADYQVVAVNMSLGSPPNGTAACNESAYYQPLRVLRHDLDVVAAISSGNDASRDNVGYPGCVSLAMTVGAQFDTDVKSYSGTACSQTPEHPGELACFANLGGMLDLVAPGVRVDAAGKVYTGTSQAAPHVAGATALVQAWNLSSGGAIDSAYWAQKEVLALTAVTPWKGRAFASLRMDSGFHYDRAWGFGGWYREDPQAEIPKSPAAFTRTLTASKLGFTVASAYLYLELLHDAPDALTVTITSPSGKKASTSLPGGMTNFTGIVGHTWAPGALDGLAGSPGDGPWTIAITDASGAAPGHYLDAALFFVKQGCKPVCLDEGCGDDQCGGACGSCRIEGACFAQGTKNPGNACQVCDAAASSTSWSPLSGTKCDDGNPCTKTDACQAGACVGKDPVQCTAMDDCHVAGVCEKKTGKCTNPKAGDGKACDDGDACTQKDACKAGVCVGADPVVCPAAGPCEESPSCDAKTGACVPVARPDGAGCDDGDLCTTVDTCQGGVCSGAPRACPPKDACHVEGTCSAGACVDVAAPDGTACPGGACAGGECKPGATPASARSAAPSEEEGGCGCRAAGAGAIDARAVAAALAAIAIAARRRRRAAR